MEKKKRVIEREVVKSATANSFLEDVVPILKYCDELISILGPPILRTFSNNSLCCLTTLSQIFTPRGLSVLSCAINFAYITIEFWIEKKIKDSFQKYIKLNIIKLLIITITLLYCNISQFSKEFSILSTL